jgi:hypothetical protein
MPEHFEVGTSVVMARLGRGVVIERDGRGGMVVRWSLGATSTLRPYALAHETSVIPPGQTNE